MRRLKLPSPSLKARPRLERLEDRTVPDGSASRLLGAAAPDAAWLDGVYSRFLGRGSDAAGESFWLGHLAEGATPRQVVAAVLGSAEYGSRADGSWLASVYDDLLLRAPDASGSDYWKSVLTAGKARAAVVDGVLSSPEFRSLDAAAAPVMFRPLLTPNDPNFTNGNLYGLSGTFGIRAPSAWDTTTGATNVTVAVIDTGVDYDHPDLYLNIWLNQTEIPPSRQANLTDVDGDSLITFWDLNNTTNQGAGKIVDQNGDGRISGSDVLTPMNVDQFGNDLGTGGWADLVDGDPGNPLTANDYTDDLVGWNFFDDLDPTLWNKPLDDNSHGTHVAGTIGAIGNNGLGVVGVNWKTQIMALRFIGLGPNGYEGADDDAAAAIRYAADNGARVSNNSYGGDEAAPLIDAAVNEVAAQGHLFVVAAGNAGADIGVTPTYPAASHLPNMLVVASTTSSGALSSFSNFSATLVDVAAPGSGILSTMPGGGYGTKSGTSMATPHTAGAAALILSANPTLTVAQLRTTVMSGVTPLGSLAGKAVTGGLVNVANAFAFGNWQNLGGPLTLVAAGENANGTAQTFALGASGDLNFRTRQADGSWGAWQTLGGICKEVVATRNAAGLLDVFVTGSTDALWTRTQTAPGVFGGWTFLGGICHGLAAGTAADGSEQVFVLGTDNGLWTQRQIGGAWSGWQSLGGLCKEIAVVRNAAGLLDVFAIGITDVLWTRSQAAPGVFGGWTPLDGINHGLVAATAADGSIQVFVLGTANDVLTRRQATPGGAYTAWQSLGGTYSHLALARNAAGWIDVLALGLDGRVRSATQAAAGLFVAWYDLGGNMTKLLAASDAAGRVSAFAAATGDVVWARRQVSGGVW